MKYSEIYEFLTPGTYIKMIGDNSYNGIPYEYFQLYYDDDHNDTTGENIIDDVEIFDIGAIIDHVVITISDYNLSQYEKDSLVEIFKRLRK